MTKETIADVTCRNAVQEERINGLNRDNARLEKERDALAQKVSTLREEVVEVKAERDRLVGYVHRVQDTEQPEEVVKDCPPDHHQPSHDMYDFGGNMSNRPEKKQPWHA